jgi:uroporphyrinogen decarboxylase
MGMFSNCLTKLNILNWRCFFLNSRERVFTTLQFKEPDRVPVYPIMSGVNRLSVGASYKKWATDADTFVESFCKVVDEVGLDSIVTLIDLSVECDAWGCKIIYPENEAAHPDYDDCLIKDIDDYKKIKKVDYRNSKRMMMHIEACKKLVERKGHEVPVVAFVYGPLGVLSMMRNQADMYIDIIDDWETVYEACSNVNETLKEYTAALCDTGVDAVMLDTLYASGAIMSKPMWKKMEGGLAKDLAKVIHDKGKAVMIHNCGNNIYFDAQIESMGPVAAISFSQTPDDCNDYAEVKEKWGKTTTLIGCVQPEMVISATDEEWDAECKRFIDLYAKGGGFVLATGCEYPANSSYDRAKRMVNIAKTYGKY